MKFNVRLFTSEVKIVVEIQRRSGCSFLFHQATKNILKAAMGQEIQTSPPLAFPSSTMSTLEKQDATEEALNIALSMLKKGRLDSHVLAMESLASLTKTNAAAATSLLHGPLMSFILSWIEAGDVEDSEGHGQDHLVKMHRYALVILANCLTIMNHNEIPPVSDDLLNRLIGELHAAKDRPHDACEAAKSLKALVRCHFVRLRAHTMGAPGALLDAYQQGKYQHQQLEKESLSLQMEMGS